MNSQQARFLAEILGVEVAEKICTLAEEESAHLEELGIKYKSIPISFADYDAQVDSDYSKNIGQVYLELIGNILGSGAPKTEQAAQIRQATDEFLSRLNAPAVNTPGRPLLSGKSKADDYVAPYIDLLFRQRRYQRMTSKDKALQGMRERGGAVADIADIIAGQKTLDRGAQTEVKELRKGGPAAQAVADLIEHGAVQG